MSLSIKLGNILYRKAFFLYRPLYYAFKKKQDRFEIELLSRLIKPGAQVMDIGANIGFYAEIISELCGVTGKVHCFEPDALNFSYLKKACGQRSNAILNQKAVGAKTEQIKFYTSPALNVDHRTYEPEQYESVSEVSAVAIDDYLQTHSKKVDVIKMDIQGFEMQAFAGMKNCLKENAHILLISEFWPYGLQRSGSSATAYYQALQDADFKIWLIEKNQLTELKLPQVQEMEKLGEAHYFNILASRQHVH